VTGFILLRVRGKGDLGYGDRVAFSGVLRAPRPPRNPGAFDSRAYAQLRGISGSVFLSDTDTLRVLKRDEGHPLLSWVVLPVRRATRATIERDLSGNPSALLRGILLGDRQSFPQNLLDDFTATGLTHTLAVSGFNVGIVALVGFTILRMCSLRRLTTAVAVILLLILYALVTGLSPSVVRAALMACILIVGAALERDSDALNTLGLSAVILLTIWPLSLFDPGFQLSFVATLSLIVLSRPLMDLFPDPPGVSPALWKRGLWTPFAASLAAQIGSLPVVAYHFQTLSLASFAANLPAAPLVSAATVLGVLSALLGPLLPSLSTLINGANYLLLRALLTVVRLFAQIPCAAVGVPRPPLLALGVYYLTVGLFLVRGSRLGKPCLFAALLLANLLAWRGLSEPGPGLEAVFLDVGQGDGLFLRFPDGKTMLVDGGMRSERSDAGRQVILPFLKYHNVRHIDVVVASHPHEDHIGGLVEVLQQVRVSHYVDSGQASNAWTSGRIREIIRKKAISYHEVAAGDSLIGLGGVGALVLHPTPEFVCRDTALAPPLGLNNGSVVLGLSYRGSRLLLTGDIEQEAESRIAAWGPRLKGDVLKVAHHGSRTSSTRNFTALVSPSVAVISAGERNRFGHPAAEVIERYESSSVRVCRTDRHGAVTVRIDGRGLRLNTLLP
jgi:competence protein ComEC